MTRMCSCSLLQAFGFILIAGRFACNEVWGFSIKKEGMPGIWKLKLSEGAFPLAPPQSEEDIFRSQLLAREKEYPKKDDTPVDNNNNNNNDEILLKLNPDGTFRQCSEGYQEGCWISGKWNLKTDGDLLLAFDRQYYGPQRDTLLQGTLRPTESAEKSITSTSIISSPSLTCAGDVFSGKFCYPKQHPAFFEEPIASSHRNHTGNFTLVQAVATYSIQPSAAKPKKFTATSNATSYQKSDFYGRKFFMTVEPLILKRSLSKEDAEIRRNLPVDIRAMPIEFYQNNTFQAFGTNKILRGRFDILLPSERRDQYELWFQVSQFGAGRSAPGSVYSEGLGLSHHDKRSYVGEIVKTDKPDGRMRLFVSGSVTFGSDLGADARSEPVASFQLVETNDDELTLVDDDDDGLDDFNSIFE